MTSDPAPATPLPVAIGRLVRDHRTRLGLTREGLAQAGNVYGVTWGQTSIANIESGRFSPTLQTLYVLCRALSDQAPEGNAHKVSFLDLIPEDGAVELADGFAVPAGRLRRFLGDPDPSVGTRIGDGSGEFMRSLRGPQRPPTLAEKRAAAKLGISASELRDIALEHWGEPLHIVVSHEAGPDATPQARGHATRRLLDELNAYLVARHG